MKKRTGEILELLDEKYGTEFICYLNYETPWQLLIATMLSAQCTDARVNIVTKDLFRKYPSVEAFADADLKELEQDIKPTGFYHNKAKNIIACMKDIRDKYNGEVPSELEDLLSLAGVGRKTANVIRGNIYHVPSVVVDTHVKHIQSARTYEESRSGQDRTGFDEGTAGGSLDSLEYSYHYIRTYDLQCKESEM